MVFCRTHFTKDTLFFLWKSLIEFTQDILRYPYQLISNNKYCYKKQC